MAWPAQLWMLISMGGPARLWIGLVLDVRLQIRGQLTGERAYKLQAPKAKLLAQKAQAKEARARKQLRRVGVKARKQERLRKKRVRALIRAGNPVPLEDQDPILDPEAGSKPGFELEYKGENGRESKSGESDRFVG
ncbi:hypothetical protein VE04_04303 [Pseudogymnoascus sp. 24MN13]|nr:hypothetical protein VE04_04303 [Pseudogymnoascus sp. 24MN13]